MKNSAKVATKQILAAKEEKLVTLAAVLAAVLIAIWSPVSS